MKLICDLCGNVLTEIDDESAQCAHCGMEYGPERLQELRKAAPDPQPIPIPEPEPKPEPEQEQKKKKSGGGVWFFLIMAAADLLIGTHGIVAVFCLLIAWIISRCSRKK